MVCDGRQRLLTFGLDQHLEALTAQVHAQQVGDRRLVLDDQHHPTAVGHASVLSEASSGAC